MEHSPAGHEISVVFGNAGGIIERGREIESLGAQMIGAAGVLRAIADGGVAQQGLSIEKITEVIGEIDEELKLAGERYAPSGSALVAYGSVLDRVQDAMRLIVPRCQDAWDDYVAARGGFESVDHARPSGSPGAESAPGPTPEQLEHQQEIAAARGRMEDAYDDFVTEAARYDTEYESWEAAFEAASDGIREATSGGIEDGFWDDVDGIVADVLVVLQWAGIVLAVLAFVIGGPIIAALGAIAALAVLALTIYQKSRGDAGWLELGLAIVGVTPFGSLAKFSGGFKPGALGFLDDMVGGLGTSAGRVTVRAAIREFPDAFAAAGGGFRGFTGAMRGSAAFDDVVARIMGMGDNAQLTEAMGRGGWGIAGTVLGHHGWVVNSPAAVVMTTYDWVSGFGDDQQVETWERQLAAAS
ncbi:hypothetical protein EDM22_17530 [Agromyces tardus]|uniref:Uncharacterized protein n=1 Tax=Agromyces tardus TaxID=2583849 RepID=A0A3M8A040_9MICO|nr:hypothetical protein [Agromyces tardus]RNB44600.1 hypothetical protein EDM22_17530 [Agromyces tardus]